mmetsp:Transcript_42086/g.105892  ORF Transcript_42086/g.105892 Transcript_42086/m.105892 type:complete len:238 (-) Transcript_42086:1744-2457(-)
MRPVSSSPASTTARRESTGNVPKMRRRTSSTADGSMSCHGSASVAVATDKCKIRAKFEAQLCTNWKHTRPSDASGVASTPGLWSQKNSSFPTCPPKRCSFARVCKRSQLDSVVPASCSGNRPTYFSKAFRGSSATNGERPKSMSGSSNSTTGILRLVEESARSSSSLSSDLLRFCCWECEEEEASTPEDGIFGADPSFTSRHSCRSASSAERPLLATTPVELPVRVAMPVVPTDSST